MAQKQNYSTGIKSRKKKLIDELINSDPVAKAGKKIAAVCIALIAVTRLALALYEIIYLSVAKVTIQVIPMLLIIPGMLMLYLIYDGNKALSSIISIAAVVRIFYLFIGTFPLLPKNAGAVVFLAVSSAILLLQLITSVIVYINPACDKYFIGVKKINLRVQAEFLSKK